MICLPLFPGNGVGIHLALVVARAEEPADYSCDQDCRQEPEKGAGEVGFFWENRAKKTGETGLSR